MFLCSHNPQILDKNNEVIDILLENADLVDTSGK